MRPAERPKVIGISRLASAVSYNALLLEIVERFQQVHRGFMIETLTLVADLIEPLEVRGKLGPPLDQQDEVAPIERHRSASLDQHVGVDNGLLLTLGVDHLALGTDVNHCGSTATHLVKDL